MNVKVLGSGCQKCLALAEKVQTIANHNQIVIELEKVTDINQIMEWGILMTPGLVINGKLMSSGKIPSDEQILEWIS